MTPVERLQAAIDRLESMREEAPPGPWEQHLSWSSTTLYSGLDSEHPWSAVEVAAAHSRYSAQLIVTLHRTINAQLAILQFGVKRLHAVQTLTGLHVQAHEHEMALADAILGSDS